MGFPDRCQAEINAIRAEADAHAPGSPDWEYRRRAAWKLACLREGWSILDACTAQPPAAFWAATERNAA